MVLKEDWRQRPGPVTMQFSSRVTGTGVSVSCAAAVAGTSAEIFQEVGVRPQYLDIIYRVGHFKYLKNALNMLKCFN